MRSIRWLAAVTGILALGTACGGDGGGVEPNQPPVANFTAPSCTAGAPCSFTDASTDPDNNITAWEWNFGDNTPVVNLEDTPHTFAAAGTYNVSLKVTDGGGEFDTKVNAVIVAPATPQNQPPVASFTFVQTGNAVAFTSTSTDADGTIAAYEWNFGDNTTSTETNPTHTYAAVTQATTYNVTLKVTDDDGAATTSAAQAVTIQPPAPGAVCTTVGTEVNCTITVTQRSTVKFTLTGRDCELVGNRFVIEAPRAQTVFGNLCNRAVGEEYTIVEATGAPTVFEAGAQIVAQFRQGTADTGDPAPGSPAIETAGSFPSISLNIDDGGNPDLAGEPDFNDVVLTVTGIPAP